MIARLLTMLAATALMLGAAIGLAAPASAAEASPQGGEWTLASTGIVIDELDNGNFADKNGNGVACFKVNAGQTKKHDDVPSFTWKDDQVV